MRRGYFFGATITVEDDKGAEKTMRIVGADEIDTSKNYISVDSPMARALLKKAVDDEVVLHLGDEPALLYDR